MAGLIRAGFLLSLALLASGRVSAQSPGTVSAPRNWFDGPQTMCRSLDPLGFIAGGWAPAAKDSPVYMCAYPPGSRPEDVSALAKLARANQQKLPKVTFDVTFEVNGLDRTTPIPSLLLSRPPIQPKKRQPRSFCSPAFRLFTRASGARSLPLCRLT